MFRFSFFRFTISGENANASAGISYLFAVLLEKNMNFGGFILSLVNNVPYS